jgi:hypothetical protein
MSKVIGSRAQVWHGTATHTSGGLTKDDLMMNKYNRIVSKRRHSAGQNAIKHLEKSGHKGKLPNKRRAKKEEKKGGAEPTHTMPDGTVMPGATHK